MADKITYKVEGFKELGDLVSEMVSDFGEKDSKNIMRSAVRASMKGVLAQSKAILIGAQRVDTGALLQSLQVSAKIPGAKDRKSRYVTRTDVVIGQVTAYINPRKIADKKMMNYRTNSKQTAQQMGLVKVSKKHGGIIGDARANVVEFGSYKMAATPYLRGALESKGGETVNQLGQALGVAIEKYKSKHNKGL